MSDRPNVYTEDGVTFYRASALGSCPKMLAAIRQDYTPLAPPQKMLDVFAKGHSYEQLVLDRLESEGWQLGFRQGEIELPLTPSLRVIGHVDAEGHTASDPDTRVVEVKSQSTAEYDKFAEMGWNSPLFRKYEWQISPYMHALSISAVVVRVERLENEDGGMEIGRMAYEYINHPPHSISEIRARVFMVEALSKRGELPACGDVLDYPCPVYYLHETTEPLILADDELETLAIQYDDAKVEESKAKERKEQSRAALKKAMGDKLKVNLVSGTFINFYMQRNPKRFDEVKARKDGVDVDKYMSQTRSERLRVVRPE